MTDWTTGQKAHASIVANKVRSVYQNKSKNAIREWVVLWLAQANPALVLDLWGGGQSAEAMVARGLSVLSVDRAGDGKTGWRSRGVTGAQAKLALEIKADLGGYRAAWGSAAEFAPECDAAWLDLCGHWCPATAALLRACRHMKRFAVTLMPERTPLNDGRLSIAEWVVALRALVEDAGHCRVAVVHKYRREGGLWALVFLCVHDARKAKTRARALEWRQLPENRQADRDRASERARRPTVGQLRYAYIKARMTDPDYRQRVRDRLNARRRERRSDPEYRAQENERERIRMHLKYQNNAGYRAQLAAREKERRAANPGPGRPRGSQHWAARLTEDEVREIRTRRASGESLRSLAMHYGVARTTVSMICQRQTWGHVA